jgi:hypothetical protein
MFDKLMKFFNDNIYEYKIVKKPKKTVHDIHVTSKKVNKLPKYIAYKKPYYRIRKSITKNGVKTHYTIGKISSLSEAINVRDILVKNNWDIELINKYKNKYGSLTYNTDMKYIRQNVNNFAIFKNNGSDIIYIGNIATIQEAKVVRDTLVNSDWDYKIVKRYMDIYKK